ncbi:MAG: CHRD domain-containing protein [Phormidium sp. SL48-SHIP]|nr:MAG: CHRD domain-containing protein [Phormidium sp. SL48-SHIP]
MAIRLNSIGSFETGIFDESAAEIAAHDPASQRLFVVNANSANIEVLDIRDPGNPSKLFDINATNLGGIANSVAVQDGLVAVAVENNNTQEPGLVAFYDINGTLLNTVPVGALPDMLTFTPDGRTVLVANEGEPNDDYTIDPEGSVSVIDISAGVANATVRTADFTAFNDRRQELLDAGLRVFGPNASVAQDVEPEYIAVAPAGDRAFVALQENNAFAVVNIAEARIEDIVPFGFKDHSLPENGFDASDRDDAINITSHPNLVGMYQPDAIAVYEANGQTFIVTANEGDARDYDGFSEEARVKDITLDPDAFPDFWTVQTDENLGRLTITTVDGRSDGTFFNADLSGESQVPAVETDASGRAVFKLNDDQTALRYDLKVEGLDFGPILGQTPQTADTADDVTRLHLHAASTGENGPVALGILDPAQDGDFGATINEDGSTTLSGVWQDSDATNQALSAFIPSLLAANPDDEVGLYVNIHTEANPDGELRGQVTATEAYDKLFAFGARSFSIWDTQGNLIADTGSDFERITAERFPDNFNSNNDENSFDTRSDNKGPEPEGVAIGQVDGRSYAFVGLERMGGIMTYDITDPNNPVFVEYVNNRDFNGDPEAGTAGDLGAEGIIFVTPEDSPNGNPLVVVANEVSGTTTLFNVALDETPTPPTTPSSNRWQILHTSDLEGGVGAIQDAPNFAAVVEGLELDAQNQGVNSILLSAGDNYLPGPFFAAAGDGSVRETLQGVYSDLFGVDLSDIREGVGRFDITNANVIGFDASAVGNHEFDAGTSTLADIIGPDIRGDGPEDVRWLGAQFPYLSANLDFSDSNLGGLATSEILPSTAFASTPEDLDAAGAAPKLAPATIIERNGDRIGVVGITTPIVETISSTGDVAVIGPNNNDMAALANVVQPTIDQLLGQGINKIVTVSHLQQFQLEQELIPLLRGVDVAVSGGSDSILANPETRLRAGDTAALPYPVLTTNADGEPAVIVSTDGEYSYVGRLVVEFDDNGVLLPGSINPNESGPVPSDAQGVSEIWSQAAPGEDPFAPGRKGAVVRQLTDAVQGVVTAKDQQIFGTSSVFIEGRREKVRTEETTLGNLTADANLFAAQQVDPTVQVSLKNGGGIRAAIGEVIGDSGDLVPPQANPLSGKETGQISQLDIENSLRFNNELTLLTLTAEQVRQVLEHGVAETAPGQTPGRFPQVGGLSFSFDATLPPGQRVRSAAIVDESGDIVDPLVIGGEVFGDGDRPIRLVTLNFLAEGGDGYPFDDFVAQNPAFANVVELPDVLTEAGAATAAMPGSEQDALAEYLLTLGPFMEPETPAQADTRIQGLTEREDGVFDPLTGMETNDVVRLFIDTQQPINFGKFVAFVNSAQAGFRGDNGLGFLFGGQVDGIFETGADSLSGQGQPFLSDVLDLS